MDLILWRHAEAELSTNDLKRPLTAEGHQQAKCMSNWICHRFAGPYLVWTSEALRAQETASYLEGSSRQVHAFLNPGASARSILPETLKVSSTNQLVIVGHQPWLSELVYLLLFPGTHSFRKTSEIDFKHGAVCWLKIDVTSLTSVLKAFLPPRLLADYLCHQRSKSSAKIDDSTTAQ
ncbi:MAG: histidine phosphatase family protein [Neisseriaceae bacterium]